MNRQEYIIKPVNNTHRCADRPGLHIHNIRIFVQHYVAALHRLLDVLLKSNSGVEESESYLHVDGGRRHSGDDGGLGAASQRVLQDPGQLGLSEGGDSVSTDTWWPLSHTAASSRHHVPVGDVWPLLHQRCDHAAQRQQRLVDVPGLTGTFVHSPRAADVLAASQIHLKRRSQSMFV